MVLQYYCRNHNDFFGEVLFSLTIQLMMCLLKESARSALIAGGLQLSSMTLYGTGPYISCMSRAMNYSNIEEREFNRVYQLMFYKT